MDEVYGIGVICIEFVQEWFSGYESYFEFINDISNPYHSTEKLFPLVSVFDSVFASQLILCLSFGGWLNAVIKWWLLEDRPYWWVQETSYYSPAERPRLHQTQQTCETGPGSPSGHSANMAMLVTLFFMCAAHVANDRKWQIPSLVQRVACAASALAILSVFLSRLYVSAHFPHQCMLGALFGLILAPALCIYVSDPFIWSFSQRSVSAARMWHVASALCAGGVALLTYWGLTACGQDPQVTVRLAFRHCRYPEHLHVSTTPVFSLVQSTAYLLGWALSVTPEVAKYRHYTPNRSLIISGLTTALTIYGFNHMSEQICKSNTFQYYVSNFFLFTLKPMFYLRIIPYTSMWPFSGGSVWPFGGSMRVEKKVKRE